MKSEMFSVNTKDAIKGIVVAVITAVLTALVNVLQTGVIPSPADLQGVGIVALTAGLSYILKNFLTNSNDELLKKEQKIDIPTF